MREVVAEVVFVLNRPVYEHFIGFQGPVGRDFERRNRTLVFRAKQTAGVDTGELRGDIRVLTRRKTRSGLSAEIGSRVQHAMVHHVGSRPHIIRPRRPGGVLRFTVGGIVYFRSFVRHPGTRPNYFLSSWLREWVR